MDTDYKGVQTTTAKNQSEWRNWLDKNHQSEQCIWLIIYKKESKIESVYYPEAVDEALCFGWIDSKPNKRDEQSYYQFFSKRNPKSNWSKVNKDKIERLIRENRMSKTGLEMVEMAKANGAWNALDDVENLITPADLQKAFDQNLKAFKYWKQFPKSVKRGILEWILNAKKAETRHKRIQETVSMAEKR
uniref:YdeI/OmpD-associated family protein n=1 Tax=Roseivirga sp. TaxID=1964215 RepID=UPI0040475B80